MKITRQIFDNGKKIIHIDYSKKEINEVKKKLSELRKAQRQENIKSE